MDVFHLNYQSSISVQLIFAEHCLIKPEIWLDCVAYKRSLQNYIAFILLNGGIATKM